MKSYFVYIMSNHACTLYTGVTNDLFRRVIEHKSELILGFTRKYNVTKPGYFKDVNDLREAITREKQINGWTRVKKVVLIEKENPEWHDLSAEWYKT